MKIGKQVIVYSYNKEGEKNQYVINKNDHYKLIRSKITFSPDPVMNLQQESTQQLKTIDKIVPLIKKMDSLDIAAISSDFKDLGIDFKIYLHGKGVLLYVSNLRNVSNEEWIKYILSLQKLDEHWYYKTELEIYQ